MSILKRLAGVALRTRRHLAARRLRRDGPVAWCALCEGGVVVALAAPVHAQAIAIVVTRSGAPRRRLAVARSDVIAGTSVVFAPVDAAFFEGPGRCVLAVTVGGRTRRQRYTVGPRRYAGRIEGVRDYGLEGWVSPLFAQSGPAPTVSLLIDGVAVATAPLDRFRRELAFSGGRGGWNGFRLLLPATALDGRPHRIAVQAGDTTIPYGSWTARPLYNVDSTRHDRFAGWYFDRASENVPTTLRVVTEGVTRAEIRTQFRSDLKAQFGRDAASFDFRGHAIPPGSLLVAGPEGTGIVLGSVGDDLVPRLDAHRAQARAQLLAGSDPGASLGGRRAIRERLVATERGPEAAQVAFRSGPVPPAVEVAALVARAPDHLPPVCAIVPVYKGLDDVRLCLESLIPQLDPGRVRAIVIEDASPDPEIVRYLAQMRARGIAGLTILENEGNLGFIGTVNRGFALLEPGEDALLVNADTILPPGLVERLARHCHAWAGIASVTPMSNNGSIVSFPGLVDPNPPALGLGVEALDAAFARHGGAPVVIPTGVGFCLHLNRAALDEVGPLSPEWGRGYCEEVDWCLKARDLGWVHLAATDAFVIHEGSVSFGVATRTALMAVNHTRLERLYPEFMPEVYAHLRADPLEDLRIAVLLGLLAGRFTRLTLHVTHGLGGGTKRYIDDLGALPRAADHEIARLTPLRDGGEGHRLALAFDGAGLTLTVRAASLETVLAALEAAGVAIRIHVNSRIGYQSAFLDAFLSGARPYVVMLHDFQWYCPRVHLTDERHFYCGEPPPAVCQICVASGISHDFGDQNALIETDLEAWLAFNAKLLRNAERRLAPSGDTAERYARRGIADAITVVPHPEPKRPAAREIVARRAVPTGALRIAVVGANGRPKGYDILLGLSTHAARERIPFLLDVIGYTMDDARLLAQGNVTISGAYATGALRNLLAAADPDYVFLPSVWPETYSYVLSEVWDAGYPVVAFDLGAQAERIRRSGGGVLLEPTRDTRKLLDALLRCRNEIVSLEGHRDGRDEVVTLERYHGDPPGTPEDRWLG